MSLGAQAALLFLLAATVACVSWTVTHEEIFREPRDYCVECSKRSSHFVLRKFFYVFTCEYCFSHYVAAAVILMTGYRIWLTDWRGYVLAEFALVWVANFYMSLFGELRLEIRHDRQKIAVTERQVAEARAALPALEADTTGQVSVAADGGRPS